MKTTARLLPLVLTFGGTGAAGLLAEQSFEKLLGTLLGTATPAGAVVLATYFGGLVIGGLGYGRFLRRRGGGAPTLRVYGALEAWIAVACAALALASTHLASVFEPLLLLGAGRPALLVLLRMVVAAIWLLPITIPMGATFPAVVDALDRLIDAPDPEARARIRGAWVSALYTSNLVGAIVAAGLGPHLVLPRFGLDGTLWVAAGIDLFAALLGVGIAFGAGHHAGVVTRDASVAPEPGSPLARTALPLIAALSGVVLFSLEVTWTHLVGTVLGSSVYAFATMLTCVLAGLGLGAAAAGLVATRARTVRAHLPGLAFVAAWAALSVAQGRWPAVPHALAEAGAFVTTFEGAQRAGATQAILQLLPTSALLGMVYPLLLRLDVLPRASMGGVLGRMGAFNAVGSIVGAFATLFVWIPLLGAEWTLRCLAGLCLVAGTMLVALFSGTRWLRYAAPVAGAAGLVATAIAPRWDVLALTSGEQVYLERSHVRGASKLRFFAEDAHGGFTTVVETEGPDGRPLKVLLSNGKFQGNDGGEMSAQDAFALLPMMFVRTWQQALVIGLGTGRSASVVAGMGFERVTIGEIAPGIVEAAKAEFREIDGDLLSRPNVTLAMTDARNHLLVVPTLYDLISIELTSVWIAGATNLYTREFYELCRRRLREGGVLQQWIQTHHIGFDEIASVIATARAVFPQVGFYFEGGQGILVASGAPHETSPEFFRRLEARGGSFGVAAPVALSTRLHEVRLLGPRDVDALVAATRPRTNTDANRYLEYATPRHLLERTAGRANVRALSRWSTFAPQAVATDAEGPLAEAARRVTTDDMKHTLAVSE